MKKLLIPGIALMALLGAMMAGCTGAGLGEVGPSIDSINAEFVTDQQPSTDNETGQSEQDGVSVRIDITVSNFEVVDNIGGDATDDDDIFNGDDNATDDDIFNGDDNATDDDMGDGYYIYYLDRLPASLQEEVSEFEQPGTTPGFTPTTGQQQQAAWASTETSFTWENLTEGVHIFSVQLVDRDGAPLAPPVVAAAVLTVPPLQQAPSGTDNTTQTP